jgi:hypothetical protein
MVSLFSFMEPRDASVTRGADAYPLPVLAFTVALALAAQAGY